MAGGGGGGWGGVTDKSLSCSLSLPWLGSLSATSVKSCMHEGVGGGVGTHMRMRACALACALRAKLRPGGRILVAGIEEHQKQQGGGGERDCRRELREAFWLHPPPPSPTFDIHRLTFNVKSASAGSKKPPHPPFLLLFHPPLLTAGVFQAARGLPIHALLRGGTRVAPKAPSFHASAAAVSASGPPPTTTTPIVVLFLSVLQPTQRALQCR